MKVGNRGSVVAVLVTVLVIGSVLVPATASADSDQRARRTFVHASTCGDYELYAYQGGRSNRAWSQALNGRFTGNAGSPCTGDHSGRWVSGSLQTTATFRWVLGKKVIRKKVRKNCGTASGCADMLRWKHAFTITDSGARYYQGKRLVLRVTFSAPGFAKKSLVTNPAYDSGYYANRGL